MHTPVTTTEKNSKTAANPTSFFGNSSATPFFQPKLTVNQPGDAYEREADQVADQVMRMRDPSPPKQESVQLMRAPRKPVTTTGPVQRKCAACAKEEELMRMRDPSLHNQGDIQVMRALQKQGASTGTIQRKCAACAKEEELMRKESHGDSGGQTAPPIVSEVLQSGQGKPMDEPIRGFMESRFGHDFSQVRIHTDGHAAESANAIQAHAYTAGNNIVFGRDAYQPNSDTGKRLLAHELAHVGQQGGSQVRRSFFGVTAKNICEEGEKSKDTSVPEETKTGRNYTPGEGICIITHPRKEIPPEGTVADEGGDASTVGMAEKMPVAERQKLAPDPGAGAPAGDPNLAENIEKGAKIKDILCPDSPPQLPEPNIGSKPAKPRKRAKMPQRDAKENDHKKQKKTEKSAADIAPNEVVPTNEEKSPNPLEATEGQILSPFEQSKISLAVALEQARNNSAGPVQFNSDSINKGDQEQAARERENMARNEGLSANLMSTVWTNAKAVYQNSITATDAIQVNADQQASFINLATERELATTKSKFTDLKKQAKGKINSAVKRVDKSYKKSLKDLDFSRKEAVDKIETKYKDSGTALEKSAKDTLTDIFQNYKTGFGQIIDTGKKYGKQANSRAYKHAHRYEFALDASEHDRYLVQYEESDGVLDGKLTYNRFMARRDAALNVGKQFSEGFETQTYEIAGKLLCGRDKDVNTILETTRGGAEAHICLRDKALAAVEAQYNAHVRTATETHVETMDALKEARRVAMTALKEQEKRQITEIQTLGTARIDEVQQLAAQRQMAILQKNTQALEAMAAYALQFRTGVWDLGIPDPLDFEQQLAVEFVKMDETYLNTSLDIDLMLGASQQLLEQKSIGTIAEIVQIQETGSTEAEVKVNATVEEVSSVSAKVQRGLVLLVKNGTTALDFEKTKGVDSIGAVNTGVGSLYTKITSGITATFSNTAKQVGEGFQKSIDDDLDKKVCKYAEEAAAAVKPRWKKVLKVLLIILVVVVVLVVAPALIAAVGSAATALAGSLGAAAMLAGSIGAWVGPIVGGAILGALSSTAIQVGSNAIDGVKLTTGLKDAIISGAIGGALGGLGGKLAAVWVGRAAAAASATGRTASGLSQFARQQGTDLAFDLLGNIGGDLATGREITIESLAIGIAQGKAIQVGTKLVGTVGNVATTKTKIGGGLGAKFDAFQQKSVEFGESIGSKAAFGPKAPTADWIKAAQGVANTRIETGKLPSSDPLGTPVPGRDIDVPPGQSGITKSTEAATVKSTESETVTPATPKPDTDTPSVPKVKEKVPDTADAPASSKSDIPASPHSEGSHASATQSGHKISESPSGELIRCSPSCTFLRTRYEVELSNPANRKLLKKLQKIQKMPRGKARTDAAGKLADELHLVRETGEISHKRWDDPSYGVKEMIADYRAEFPNSTLSNGQLRERFKNGYRLNSKTGRFKNIDSGKNYDEIDHHAAESFLESIDAHGLNTPEARQLKTLASKRRSKIAERDQHDVKSDEYNALNQEVRSYSEKIGEKASDLYMKEKYGLDPVYTGKGSRTLDKVYRDKKGQLFVLEAKGGASGLGTKISTDPATKGDIMQQGSREYLKQTIQEMKADPKTKALATELENALKAGKLKYLKVAQPVDSNHQLSEMEVSEFTL